MIGLDEVVAMYDSEIGARLRSATWVERELPFSYALSATEAYQGLRFVKELSSADEQESLKVLTELENETVLIQGVVDCIFRVDGKLVLLDYKTDRVLEKRGGVETLAEQYRFQLELYGKALEDIMGEPVSEKWLYFFDGSHLVQI